MRAQHSFGVNQIREKGCGYAGTTREEGFAVRKVQSENTLFMNVAKAKITGISRKVLKTFNSIRRKVENFF